MRFKLLKKYFSIVFLLATLMGVFHHHEDHKQHSDCQVCTIQSNISNADIPTDTDYLSKIELFTEAVVSKLPHLHECKTLILLKARAPPFFS
jgi:hypothetical protein